MDDPKVESYKHASFFLVSSTIQSSGEDLDSVKAAKCDKNGKTGIDDESTSNSADSRSDCSRYVK